MDKSQEPAITLGWRVTPALEPAYWLTDSPGPGKQTSHDLIQVPTTAMSCHTAIIAQSGHGKSFFLGRLIEELLLETSARCVILDCNADFRRIKTLVDRDRWKNPRYDRKKATGHLPSELNRKKFEARWTDVHKRVLRGPGGADKQDQWKLPLQSLSFELLADNRRLLADLYHCHQFVITIGYLLALEHRLSRSKHMRPDEKHIWNIDERANKIFKDFGGIKNFEERRDKIADVFRGLWHKPNDFKLDLSTPFLNVTRNFKADEINNFIGECADHVQYISKETAKYYFGRVAAEVHKDIVETNVAEIAGRSKKPISHQLHVVDLPSFPDPEARFLAVDSVLVQILKRAQLEWEGATSSRKRDTRLPTFVVVDEAHNLMPAGECEGLPAKTIRDHFRRIAAEGRKYGVFLIICTQRPEKLDPTVVSECENVAIMKLGSRSILEESAKLFGLEELEKFGIGRCLEFLPGRAMLCGKWARIPQTLYTAMRRTEEGGKNLRTEYWAVPGRWKEEAS